MGHPLLREQNIISGLVASNHEDALKKIVAALPDSSLTPRERLKVLDLLLLREEMGTTAIGQGIALPHCFTSLVTQPLVAFAVSPEGIPYASLDGLPVHFIFTLILPSGEAAEKQKRQILQNIKWILCDRYMQERLKAAPSASEIHRLVLRSPQKVAAVCF